MEKMLKKNKYCLSSSSYIFLCLFYLLLKISIVTASEDEKCVIDNKFDAWEKARQNENIFIAKGFSCHGNVVAERTGITEKDKECHSEKYAQHIILANDEKGKRSWFGINVTLKPDHKYVLTFYIKIKEGICDLRVVERKKWKLLSRSKINYMDKWVKKEITFDTPEYARRVGIYFFNASSKTDFYLDDISLKDAHECDNASSETKQKKIAAYDPALPEKDNLIGDGSFELIGEEGKPIFPWSGNLNPLFWKSWKNALTVKNGAHSGEHAIKISGKEGKIAFDYNSLKKGNSYRIGIWNKTGNLPDELNSFFLYVDLFSKKGESCSCYKSYKFDLPMKKHDWSFNSFNIHIDKTTRYAKIGIALKSSSKQSDIYVDDLTLQNITNEFKSGNRLINAYKTDNPVNIDGRLDEAFWHKIPDSEAFLAFNSDKADEATRCKIAYDEKNLYLAFSGVYKESPVSNVKDRDAAVWTDDSIEIFLDTNSDRNSYYQFITNATGTKFDSYGDNKRNINNSGWNSDWLTASSFDKGKWTLELAIPFKDLKLPSPDTGSVWGINLARNHKSSGKITTWSPLEGKLNQAKYFGKLVFGSSKELFNRKLAELEGKLRNSSLQDKNSIEAQISRLKQKIKNSNEIGREKFLALGKELEHISYEIDRMQFHGKKYIVWYKSPWASIGASEFPKNKSEEINSLSVCEAIGEKAITAFLLTNLSDKTMSARIIPDEFYRSSGCIKIPKEKIVIRVGTYVKTKSGNIIADALPLMNEAHEFSISPGRTRQLWLEINTVSILPGQYKGRIRIKPLYGNYDAKSIDLTLNIYPVQLPENVLSSFVFSSIHKPQNIAKIIDDISAHGINTFYMVYPYNAIPSFDTDGNIIKQPDFSGLDKILSLLKNKHMKIILHIPAQQGVYMRLPGMEEKMPSEKWENGFRNFIRMLVAHLKEQGFDYDDFFFHFVDEPAGGKVETAVCAARAGKDADDRIKIWVDIPATTSHEELKKLEPYIDVWCPWFGNLSRSDDLNFYFNKPRQVWSYTCPGNAKDQHPFFHHRLKAWHAWQKKLGGICYWAYNSFMKDPWDDSDSVYGHDNWGDASLIYGEDPVIPSKRWEAFREAIDDYRCLYLLKETIKEADKLGINTSSASKIIEDAVQNVILAENEDSADIERKRILENIVNLNRQITPAAKNFHINISDEKAEISWETEKPAESLIYYTAPEENICDTFESENPSFKAEFKLNIPKGKYSAWCYIRNNLGYLQLVKYLPSLSKKIN